MPYHAITVESSHRFKKTIRARERTWTFQKRFDSWKKAYGWMVLAHWSVADYGGLTEYLVLVKRLKSGKEAYGVYESVIRGNRKRTYPGL